MSVRVLPALMVPIILIILIILIIGIVGGFATTTKVSSIAVVFSIIVSVFIYRGMNFKSFITTLADSAAMVGMVLFMVSSGSALSWTLAVRGLQSVVGKFLMLLQLTKNYGIDPMAFGTVIIIAMGIGSFIPPFGVCYFVTCSVMYATVEKATPRFLPYLAVLLIGLVCIALFPAISLALPHAFGLC